MLAFCLLLKYAVKYLPLWHLHHCVTPPQLGLAKYQKISQNASCEQFHHYPCMKMTGEPMCPRKTLSHLTSETLMDIFPGCVKVVLGALGDWEDFPTVTDHIFHK